jgi:hypothetical protein
VLSRTSTPIYRRRPKLATKGIRHTAKVDINRGPVHAGAPAIRPCLMIGWVNAHPVLSIRNRAERRMGTDRTQLPDQGERRM